MGDISSSLSVTPDRYLYEPAPMRANTLTANKSLIEGTNVGTGVPDDELQPPCLRSGGAMLKFSHVPFASLRGSGNCHVSRFKERLCAFGKCFTFD